MNLGDKKSGNKFVSIKKKHEMNKKGSKSACVPFLIEIQIEIEKSERFEVGSLYVRRKKTVTEFLMVLSITNFGILCLFFYMISISVSSVELQDLYILEYIYRIKDMVSRSVVYNQAGLNLSCQKL